MPFENILLFGAIYGIIIFFIIKAVKDRKKKQEEAREREEKARHQAREREERARHQAREREEKARKIELMTRGITVASDSLTEKYKNNPKAISAAEKFADEFIKGIKRSNRDIRITQINYYLEMGAIISKVPNATCTRIGAVNSYYNDYHGHYVFAYIPYDYFNCEHYFEDILDFTAENLRPIQDKTEMLAFVRAIALNAYEMINKKYTKDESGTDCNITMSEFSGDDDGDYGISIKFSYSAKNGFYTAPTEW